MNNNRPPITSAFEIHVDYEGSHKKEAQCSNVFLQVPLDGE